MLTLLLSVVLAGVPEDPRSPQRQPGSVTMPLQIDGPWTVVCCEMDGRKQDDKTFKDVTIRNNVLTCSHDGKPKSWRLEFRPGQTVWATELPLTGEIANPEPRPAATGQANRTIGKETAGPAVKQGVYVAGQDYLCFSFRHQDSARATTNIRPATTDDPRTERREGTHADHESRRRTTTPQRGDFVLVLKRATGAPER